MINKDKISKDLEIAIEIFRPWKKEKDGFAYELSYKDYDAMAEHSNNLVEIMIRVLDIFHYQDDPLYSRGPDYRSSPMIRKKTVELFKLLDVVKKDVEVASIVDYRKHIDEAEEVMLMLFENCKYLIEKGEEKKEDIRKRNKSKVKTQKEQWTEWKHWVQDESKHYIDISLDSSVYRLRDVLKKVLGKE